MFYILFFLSAVLGLFFVCMFIRLLILVFVHRRKGKETWGKSRDSPAKAMIIMGSGGHTGEMIRLINGLDPKKFSPRLYLVANTDETSKKKVKDLEETLVSRHNLNTVYDITCISRSREVHQPWLTSIFTFLRACIECISIVLNYKPDLIICNGPGTCVPPCLITFLLKLLWFNDCTIVFVESICRVTSLSLTGKIMLYLLADRTIVQWPELHASYPRTVYLGRLV